MTHTLKAKDLTYEHITNLVTVNTTVLVDNASTPATVTGLLHGIMHAGELVSLTVGSQQIGLRADDELTVHSTYIGAQTPEITALVREASKEETPA